MGRNGEKGGKRKTHFQLESLENFYLEEKYPSQKMMEDYASSLELTYQQVRRWFADKRRKEKKGTDGVLCCTAYRNVSASVRDEGLEHLDRLKNTFNVLQLDDRSVVRGDGKNTGRRVKNCKKTKHLIHVQNLLPPDDILRRVFRKDGPPLGVEFDAFPAGAFGRRSVGSSHPHPACQDFQRFPKRRKVSKSPVFDSQASQRMSVARKTYGTGKGLMSLAKKYGIGKGLMSVPVKKYGIGKGLMTVWRATNPNSGSLPTGLNVVGRQAAYLRNFRQPPHQELRSQHQRLALKQRKLGKKLPDKRKAPIRKRKVECNKDNRKKSCKAECKLAMEDLRPHQESNVLSGLIDDEELELRELQAGPNPLTCSAHLVTNQRHGCTLCKDLLSRFPPQSVKMKHPLCARPWNSSPEIVRKLFKVLRFLYTHAVAVDVSPFSIDEFAQALHDKESLLLGKIHVALLKVLLSDVERELSSGFLPRTSKDSRYIWFLHFVRDQEFDVKFWNMSLNPLTWTEILRQVLIAAGFGVKQHLCRRQILSKEGNRMARFGLRHGTLKGELFNILSEQGSNGSKVSELAKAPQIVGLNLSNTVDEVESQICSTLSSDITLFEKISAYAYRLRPNLLISISIENFESDSEDSGSVDDDSMDFTSNSSSSGSDDFEECSSGAREHRIIKYKGHQKQKNSKKVTEYSEIDESHSGEAWVLGLMEGEYSDLNIEEKLNALVALVDLTGAGSSIKVEDPVCTNSERILHTRHHGSGAKIKRSTLNENTLLKSSWDHVGLLHNLKQIHASKTRNTKALDESGSDMHPLQSIYLGSDRRYNSYWLFLGPCTEKDPGHRRVYFESSEDGHWEVIDTQEALHALVSVLDARGLREAHLFASLENREASLCQAMCSHMAVVNDSRQSTRSDQSGTGISGGDGSSPISDVDNGLAQLETINSSASSGAILLELGKSSEENRQKWDRLQALDRWIWNSFYSCLSAVKYGKRSFLESLARCESCHDLYWRDEKHCKTCHTTFELDFDMEERYTVHTATCRGKEDGDSFPNHKVLSSQLQSLKAAVHAVEAVMPEEALVSVWRRSIHKLWVKRLRRTSSLSELLQVISDFVGAINEEWLCQSSIILGPNTALEEIVVFFPTIPQTTSSVALWLVKLDAVVSPHMERVHSQNADRTQQSNPRTKGRSSSGQYRFS